MYKLQTLPNGVRLLTVPMPATQTFTILVMVATGSRYESRALNGISHFLEHMFFKGTAKRPSAFAISSALDKVGGEFNAFTSKEYTGYYAKVDGAHALLALDVIADILLHSKFERREIERERGVILEEINMYENNPILHIEDLFESCLYGDTPAGWDTIGTKANVKNFSRNDFLSYWRSHYQSRNMVIALAGRFHSKDASISKKFFREIPAGAKNKTIISLRPQTTPALKVKEQKTQQTNLSIGVRAYSYFDSNYPTLKLLGIILGASMSSRLFIAVRERRGLAYQVHTNVEGYADSGYLTTNIGASADKIEAAVKVVLREYRRIAKELVSAAELKKAKDYFKGKVALQLESSENMASWFSRQAVLGLPLLTAKEHIEEIMRVSRTDVKRVANQIFQNNGLNLAVIGYRINTGGLTKILKL